MKYKSAMLQQKRTKTDTVVWLVKEVSPKIEHNLGSSYDSVVFG